MRFIILKERSEGNESVGTMWTETFTFDGSATLDEVLRTVAGSGLTDFGDGKKITERDLRSATMYGKLVVTVASNEP